MNQTTKRKKKHKAPTPRLPVNTKMRRRFSVYMAVVLCVLCTTTVRAADDPIAVVNNLSTFIFGLVRAVGMILIGYGIVQIGLSLKSHDPSQRANGIMTVAGGIVVTFAKEILNTIAG
ncbi:TrbC/VirB2 family protein [Eubacterium callanderi]|uniref:TrbC/VirB2 family protein n=1 Tax=Eubacterium callanderi TaxID=53442 RepID=UPI003999D4C8